MLHVILKPPFNELLANQEFDRGELSPDHKYKCAHFEIGQSTAAVNLDLVDSVWADGPELVEIIKNFEGVPKRFNRHYDHDQTMKWFGDDARFIVANWT